MAHLIDKDALVAEIEKRRNDYINSLMTEQVHTLSDILEYIDTLEVKEVDLEKELDYVDYINFFNEHPDYNNNEWGFDEAWMFANYFFKLGLKAQKG